MKSKNILPTLPTINQHLNSHSRNSQLLAPPTGMQGALIDVIGSNNGAEFYHPGNGVRTYNPATNQVLTMQQPDLGTDAKSSSKVPVLVGVVLGVAGIMFTIVTMGFGAIALSGIAFGLMVASGVVGILSGTAGIAAGLAYSAGNHKLGGTLGRVALGLGVASFILGLASTGFNAWAIATNRAIIGRVSGQSYFFHKSSREFLYFNSRFKNGQLIITHGGERGLQSPLTGEFLTPKAWANELSKLSVYQTGQSGAHGKGPLYLMACRSTAYGSGSNAAKISQVLNREIIAFSSNTTLQNQSTLARTIQTNLLGSAPTANAKFGFSGLTYGKAMAFKNGKII